MKNRAFFIILSALTVVVIALMLYRWRHETEQMKPLPVLGQAPEFTLTDSNGEQFSSKQLAGKVWVTDFIFTTCPTMCPQMTTNLASVHRSYSLKEDVHMVSISVNPIFDKPEVLKDYAENYQADTKKWHFLTGDEKYIHKLTYEGFKVGHKDELFKHSERFILIDRQGRVRGYYIGTDQAEVARLFRDISTLLNEKSKEKSP